MAKDKGKNKSDAKPTKGKADKPAKAGKGKGGKVDDEFGDPGERSNFKLADHEGAVLLITPRSLEEDIETSFGNADAIKADIVVLSKTNGKRLAEPEEHSGVLIFQRVVIGQLEEKVGVGRVVGVIGRGVAKKGQDAPFLIELATDEQKSWARDYLKSVDPLG